MREALHTCCAPACKARIAKRYLMCPYHWSRVPEPLREAVADAWASVQTTGMITEQYNQAVTAVKSYIHG